MFPPSKCHSTPTSFNRQTATPHLWHRKLHYCELSFSSMSHNPTEICYKTSTHICTLVFSEAKSVHVFLQVISFGLLAILIPACASSSPAFLMMYSAFIGISQCMIIYQRVLFFSDTFS